MYMFDYMIYVCVYEIQRIFRIFFFLYMYNDIFRNFCFFWLEYFDRYEIWQVDL